MLLCYKHLLGLSLLALLAPQGSHGQANLRRCYACRSRGEKGDCRDSFIRPQLAPTDLKEGEEAGSTSGIIAAQSYNQMHWTTNVNDTGYKKHGLIGMSRAVQFHSPKPIFQRHCSN